MRNLLNRFALASGVVITAAAATYGWSAVFAVLVDRMVNHMGFEPEWAGAMVGIGTMACVTMMISIYSDWVRK